VEYPRRRGKSDGTPGERVKFARRALHWTQADLAGKSGVHPVTVSHVECGTRPLSPELALAIAAATGRTPAFFLPDRPWGTPAKLLRVVRSESGQYLPRGPADEATWSQIAGSRPVRLEELLELADARGITVEFGPRPR
jgi:transcriptional regulator with XRE-family HTH domain